MSVASEAKAFTLSEKIDADDGLKSKRRLLTISSLILLGMTLSDATVVEANTIFFKIVFNNQSGLLLLLLLSIIFLLIRYFNYAEKYHAELFKSWSDRMLKEPFFFHYCHHSDNITGLTVQIQPKGAGLDNPHLVEPNISHFSYGCRVLFRRHIHYSWCHGFDEGNEIVSILGKGGFKQYLRVLALELKYQISSFFIQREQLDILAPYFLGLAAICSYLFNEECHAIAVVLLKAAGS